MATDGAKAGPGSGPAFAPRPALPDDVALWLVRHGDTEWSQAGKHTGRTDVSLTPSGERQARALRAVLADVRPALVLCSPRSRATETAALAGLVVDEIDEDLAEWDYGAYEGRTSEQIRAERPGWTLWQDGALDGEGIDAVATRADRVLTRARDALPDGPVVLVGHGHMSRVIGARWVGLPAVSGGNMLLGTAAYCVLGAQYGLPAIAHWNMPNPANREGTPH